MIKVKFTGPGMNTESGLPDFSSAQGMWKVRPESLATLEALRTQSDEFNVCLDFVLGNFFSRGCRKIFHKIPFSIAFIGGIILTSVENQMLKVYANFEYRRC